MLQRPSRRFVVIAACVSVVVLVSLSLIFIFGHASPSSDGSKANWHPANSVPLITAAHGLVATDNANCSIIGRDILEKKGGNAVDAAIASMLCLGVLQNFASGIGGGGIMVIRLANGSVHTIDFREWAPLHSTSTMFVGHPNASTFGSLAIAVPAELAGLEKAHNLYGKAKWKDLVQPAIDLATSSYVGAQLAKTLASNEADIDRWGNKDFKKIYKPDGVLLKEGDICKQPKLAATLQTIATQGASAFYQGTIADQIAQEVQKAGGILTSEDLAQYYARGVEQKPAIYNWYQGYKIIGARLPISGGICSQFSLNILEYFNLPKGGFISQNVHWMIESWKYTFSDRRALGDPSFWNVGGLVDTMGSKDHAAELRNNLSPNTTYDVPHYQDLSDETDIAHDGGTSHIAVVDSFGNAVSTTTTVNGAFGSYFISPSSGVLLNNQMDDFSTPNASNAYHLPPSVANFIAPQKRPMSSMTPTIVLKNDNLYMVVGGSGGSRIITATLQVFLNVVAFSMNIADAIAFPRLHNQLIPSETLAEVDYPPWILTELRARNHTIQFKNPLSAVQGIVVGDDALLYGASDWRKLGLPAGY